MSDLCKAKILHQKQQESILSTFYFEYDNFCTPIVSEYTAAALGGLCSRLSQHNCIIYVAAIAAASSTHYPAVLDACHSHA